MVILNLTTGMAWNIKPTSITERICDVDTSHSNRHYRRLNNLSPALMLLDTYPHSWRPDRALISTLNTQQHAALLFVVRKRVI
jgi:hypothetical protein